MDRARGTADGSGRPIDGILHHADGVLDADRAWQLLLAVRRCVDGGEVRAADGRLGFSFVASACRPDDPDRAELVVDLPGAVLARSRRALDPAAAEILELHLPQALCTRAQGHLVAILGQSLDGFIATHSGDSQFVTGEENLRHMHRMRALSDAVIVGAGTVAADDPQLTTRQVSGTSPLRVVIDPMRRLAPTYRVFQDEAAPTLYVCGRGRLGRGEHFVGAADVLGVHEGPGGLDLAELVDHLRGRGRARLFVEGGGVTVSAFLAAGLLGRLHVAVAPFLIGAGRPAIRLPAPDLLRECARPRHRVFRMGTDVLFDCDMRAADDAASEAGAEANVTRVI
jgi:diaminohydroxyphosphoribosylaminopyrimidine deaminase/5-amino-6-(5-phosphoribosylamino)uracil reductase